MSSFNTTAAAAIPILKLSVRSDEAYRDITIRLTERSLLLVLWLGLGIVLLYEILSVWILFLFHCYHKQPNRNSITREEGRDEEQGSGLQVDSDPLPLVSSRKDQQAEPSRFIVLLWGISTAYAIFYSFEMTFLYFNDRWYQLLGVQILLSASDILTWIHLVACCKYGVTACSPLTQTCAGIKLLHVLFNLLMESRESITSARHWMFLLEDATYLWCCRSWLGAQPRKLFSIRGIALLFLGAASCALLIHNLTSMNRITRM